MIAIPNCHRAHIPSPSEPGQLYDPELTGSLKEGKDGAGRWPVALERGVPETGMEKNDKDEKNKIKR